MEGEKKAFLGSSPLFLSGQTSQPSSPGQGPLPFIYPHAANNPGAIHTPLFGKSQKAKPTGLDLRISSLSCSRSLPSYLSHCPSKEQIVYTFPHPFHLLTPASPSMGTTQRGSLFRNLPTHQPERPERDRIHHCNSTDLSKYLESWSFSELERKRTAER